MMSKAPSSATPNDACIRRTFSATRCSWVPENRAPATSAPTTTSATIARASAIPRSFFSTCFIDRSLRFTFPPGPSAAEPGRYRARTTARVVPQGYPRHDTVHLVVLNARTAADGRRRPRAQHDLDRGHLCRHVGHSPASVVIREREAVRPDEGTHHGLNRGACRGVALSEIPAAVARLIAAVDHLVEAPHRRPVQNRAGLVQGRVVDPLRLQRQDVSRIRRHPAISANARHRIPLELRIEPLVIIPGLGVAFPVDQDRVTPAEGLPIAVNRRGSNGHQDRKSTRLNSSHSQISYAVFCLKKKKKDDLSITASTIPA